MLAAIAFYVLAVLAIVSAFAVIAARNPVHSVLFLILTFFTAAGLFVLLGAEFTQQWAERHGKEAEPEEGAMRQPA